jgi:23S rRNA pseudouridine1911/1915/1917 synthase
MSRIETTVEAIYTGKRLDGVLPDIAKVKGIELSRSALKSRNLQALINGKPEKWSYKVSEGDRLEVDIPDPKELDMTAQDLPFDILYLDSDIAVVNKPFGMAVHPSKGHEDGTLVNGLLHKIGSSLSSIGGVERPGIVHRLDKDTAGLLVIALNDTAHHRLSEAFQDHKVKKIYHAVVKGRTDPVGRMDDPIGRSSKDRKKMTVRADGKPSITEYKVLSYLKDHSYVEINLLTGRTHQIRVHFTCIGHPVAGDPLYSRKANSYGLTGIALCAKKLAFDHPVSGKRMEFEIPLPEELEKLIKRLSI